MSANAPRSIDEYLKQLRAALGGQDAALIQDALYDAEEYLRAEVAAHPGKSEADVLELIASTYGAPEEVAAAYRDTEAKVKAALKTPAPAGVFAHSAGVSACVQPSKLTICCCCAAVGATAPCAWPRVASTA